MCYCALSSWVPKGHSPRDRNLEVQPVAIAPKVPRHVDPVSFVHFVDATPPALEHCLYEVDHCTAFGPCSTRGITPSSLLVCGEQMSRQIGETAREPKLPDNSRDPENYILTTASAPPTACFVTGQHYPMHPATPDEVRKQAKAG